MHNQSLVIIGLGNSLRSDDGAGLKAAEILSRRVPENVTVVMGVSDGTSLMEIWSNYETAIIVDSVVSGEKPGSIFRYDGLGEKIPEDYFRGYSTHAFSIVETIELARALEELPDKLVIYGIESVNFEPGDKLSLEVSRAVDNVTDEIYETYIEKRGE